MQEHPSQFEKRKQDHIELALMNSNQAVELNRFDDVFLVHEAIPDFDFDEISLNAKRLGQSVTTPFLVSSMTAGHHNALSINRTLMEACALSGWGMGVGSQRRELFDPQATLEWKSLRRAFPKVRLMSNLGITQAITADLSQINAIIDGLEADALIIHLNPLQEVIQPEGTPQFNGAWKAIERLVNAIPVPIVIKETGCGFSSSTLNRLNDLGVAAVDVSGGGGTHWGRIEGERAQERSIRQKTAETFRNWGISTLESLNNAVSIHPTFEIWGSGGVRHGLDAAKLFALGASTVGFAKPMLEAALLGIEQLMEKISLIEYELKVAMFCTGSRTLLALKEKLCR